MKRMMIALLLLVCIVMIQGSVFAQSLAYDTGTAALTDGDDGGTVVEEPSDGDGGDSSSGEGGNE
ncbi:MAG: hypothetical protein JXB18_12180 [Sedimentisphaerales bacterium]|nr:hypothetical protein [Sedimentisphaerales bacterium]